METTSKPFVQTAVQGVHTVVHDPEGRFDADLYDRFATFEQARDAALTCLEILLDEGDYDGEEDRHAMEAMHRQLDAAGCLDDLLGAPEYRRLVSQFAPSRPVAA